MKNVLFMGDSITDAGRNRNATEVNMALGSGYATIAAADIGFRKGVEEKALVSRKIAEKYNLPFVELQAKFDAVHDPENPLLWLWDGVHPTCLGAHLIAREWIKGFESMVAGI